MVSKVPSEPDSSPPAAEIAANTSGAPFPRANSVTPANDSESYSFSVRYSSDGDRYSSAVDESVYMRMIIKSAPTGTMAMTFPESPNVDSIEQ